MERTKLSPPELPQLEPVSESLPELFSHEYVDLDQGY
jgi:hypothetical protein